MIDNFCDLGWQQSEFEAISVSPLVLEIDIRSEMKAVSYSPFYQALYIMRVCLILFFEWLNLYQYE